MGMIRYTTAVASAVLAVSIVATTAGATPVLVVNGRGLTLVRLGTSQATALAALEHELGTPTSKVTATPGLANCGVDATAAWHAMSANFHHNRLVGLSFGPSHTPRVMTSSGLHLGDTLSRARAIYGSHLRVSNAQGGVWSVSTAQGRIDGYLTPSTGRAPTARDRIETIDVGVVGCPAMSP